MLEESVCVCVCRGEIGARRLLEGWREEELDRQIDGDKCRRRHRLRKGEGATEMETNINF